MNSESFPSPEKVLAKEVEVFLATIEGNQPRVRPVTMVQNQGELFILTGSEDAKIKQIKQNKKVELVTLVRHDGRTGYIRFNAIATIVKDAHVRERVSNATSFFSQYFSGPSDPKFALLHIKPVKMEYLKPGKMFPDPIKKLAFA